MPELYAATAIQVLLFATVIAAAYSDLVHQRISNWLTFPALFLGLFLNAVVGLLQDAPTLQASLGGLSLGFGIFFVAYLVGGVGGGDVKLVAAIGAIMGTSFVVSSIFWSALAGSFMACCVLIWRGQFWAGLGSSARAILAVGRSAEPPEGEKSPSRVAIPYGFAIALGTTWAWFLSVGLVFP